MVDYCIVIRCGSLLCGVLSIYLQILSLVLHSVASAVVAHICASIFLDICL